MSSKGERHTNRMRLGFAAAGVSGNPEQDAAGNKDDAVTRRMARSSIAAFFTYGVGVALTYCSQLVIARFIGVHAFGVYAYAFAWMSVLAYVATLGFDVALLRFVPAYEAEGKWPLVRGVVGYAQRRATLVGLSVALLGTGMVTAWAASPEVRDTFVAGFLLVPVLALLRVDCAVVRAYGGVILALTPDRVVRDGLLIVLLASASFGLHWAVDAPAAMAAALGSGTVGLVCAGLALRHLRPRPLDQAMPEYDARIWRQAALPLVILGATEALMNRTGVILLGWMADTRGAGVFSLAFNIAFAVAMPRTAINVLLTPMVASLFARSERSRLQALIARAALWSFCAGIGVALPIFVLANPLLAWFGPGYETGVPALRILLLGQIIAAAAGSQLQVMMMTGQERTAAVLLASSAAANAALSAALISLGGLTGAAGAAAASLVLWNLAMALSLRRSLHLLPGILGFRHLFRFLTGHLGRHGTEGEAEAAFDGPAQKGSTT